MEQENNSKNEIKEDPVFQYELKCYAGTEPRIPVTDEFISKNNLSLNKTQDEIYQRIKNAQVFDFAGEVLVHYLDWEKAKEFYSTQFIDEIDSGSKEQPKPITDIKETAQDFLDYMVFGWMKAMDERGISASRTVNKLGHGLWLMGRSDLKSMVNDDELYNPYGTPALIAVCNEMGIKVPADLIEFSKNKC